MITHNMTIKKNKSAKSPLTTFLISHASVCLSMCLWSLRMVQQFTQCGSRARGGGGLASGQWSGLGMTRQVPWCGSTGWFQRVSVHPVVGRLLAAAVVLNQPSFTDTRANATHMEGGQTHFVFFLISNGKLLPLKRMSLLKCEKAKLNRQVIPFGIVDSFCPLLALNSSKQFH